MSAHTPGPWTLVTVPTSCGICHKIGPFPPKREGGAARHACLYADYQSQGNPADDELEANARLIAAAPDLLEALRGTLDFVERHSNRWDGAKGRHPMSIVTVARAALAKAGGQ